MSYHETLAAGQPLSIQGEGRHFRLRSTSAELDVRFYRDNKPLFSAEAVEAGYSEAFIDGEWFDRVELLSATGQVVRFDIRNTSRVSYDRAIGSVDVLGGQVQPVGGADNTASPPLVQFPSAQPVSVAASPVLPRAQPTSTYFRRSTSAALGTVFTPAANTGGAIVRVGAVRGFAGDVLRLMTKASAPTAWSDSAARTLLSFEAYQTTGGEPGPIIGDGWFYIEAGVGLYEQASGVSAQSVCELSYNLL